MCPPNVVPYSSFSISHAIANSFVMDNQVVSPAKSNQQSLESQEGSFGEHPLQASALGSGFAGQSAPPPPFNPGGGEENSAPVQLMSSSESGLQTDGGQEENNTGTVGVQDMGAGGDDAVGMEEDTDFGELVDAMEQYQIGFSTTAENGAGGAMNAALAAEGTTASNQSRGFGRMRRFGRMRDRLQSAVLDLELDLDHEFDFSLNLTPGGSNENSEQAITSGEGAQGSINHEQVSSMLEGMERITAENTGPGSLKEMVRSLGSMPVVNMIQEIPKLESQYITLRDGDREGAKGEFPSILQPMGLDPAAGDAAMQGSADPTHNPSTLTFPTSTVDQYISDPGSNNPGDNIVTMDDADGSVNLSAGARDRVNLDGDINIDRLQTDVETKRGEVLPDYNTAQTETKGDFGEGALFPGVEGERETLVGTAEFTKADAFSMEEGDPLPELGMESGEAINAALSTELGPGIDAELAREAAGWDTYETGLTTELTGWETSVDTEVATAKTAQTEAKTSAIDGITLLKQDWAGENDDNLSLYDTDALAEKELVDAAIRTELTGANSEIDTAYSEAESEAKAEHDRIEQEKNGKKPRLNGRAARWFRRTWNSFVDWVKSAWNGFKNFITGLWDGLKTKVQGIISKARTAIKGMVDGLVSKLAPIVNRIKEAFTTIRDKFIGLINTAIDTLRTTFTTIVNNLKTTVKSIIDTVSAAIVTLVEAYEDLVISVLKNIGEKLLELILAGGEAALRLLLKIAGVSDPEAVIDELVRIGGIIRDILKDPVGFAKNLINVVVETFTEYFQNFGENVREIVMTWFFGKPELEFPSDLSLDSWLKFGMDASGLDENSVTETLGAVVQLPAGVEIDFAAPLQALVTGGPDALWENVKTQLNQIPGVETATDIVGTVTEGEAGESLAEDMTPEEIREEISGMTWQTFLMEAETYMGADTVADLQNARYIFDQFVSGNLPGLIEDLKEHIGEEIRDVPAWLWGQLLEWVQNDLVTQLPILLAKFAAPGGGIGAAIKAIYDGIMWFIENRAHIWDVIETIFGALPMIANGDTDGAKAAITTGINQTIGLVLDLLTSVGLNSSPSKQLGKMVDKLKTNVKSGFDTLMKKIGAAIQKFMESIQKMLGKPRKKKSGTGQGGDNNTDPQETREKDWQGNDIPAEDKIDEKINRTLPNKIDDHWPLRFTMPSYGTSYADKVKTYKVLQGLLQAYRYDNEYQEEGEMTEEKALELAERIRNEHKVFRTFTVVDDQEADGNTFTTPEGEDYWAWEWTASPTKSAPASKKRKREDRNEVAFEILSQVKAQNGLFDIDNPPGAQDDQRAFAAAIFKKVLEQQSYDYAAAKSRLKQIFNVSGLGFVINNSFLQPVPAISSRLEEIVKAKISTGSSLERNHSNFVSNDSQYPALVMNEIVRTSRSSTRYGYDNNNTGLQGPHTVARSMGANARAERFLANPRVAARDMKRWYSDTIIDPSTLDNYQYRNPTTADNFKKDYATWYNLFQSAGGSSSQGDQKSVLIYGQILTDLHPYATSLVEDATSDELGGGGEGSAFSRLRDLAARNPNAAPATILQAMGSSTKGLVDESTFQYVSSEGSARADFQAYLNESIQQNLKTMGFIRANEVEYWIDWSLY